MEYKQRGGLSIFSPTYKKRDVDIEKAVEEQYLDDGVAKIGYKANESADVIDPHSMKGYEILDPGFIEYIERNARHISYDHPIELSISGGGFTDSDKERIADAVSMRYDFELGEFNRLKRHYIKLAVIYAIMTIITFVVSKAFEGTDIVMFEGFNILFWVFAWEFVGIFVFTIPDYIRDKRKAIQMANIKVKFI